MSQDRPQATILRPSVLDRLLDDDPTEPRGREVPAHPNQVLRFVIEAVRRDLQALLNTRQTWLDERIRGAEEAARSIAAYGMPDFVGEHLGDIEGISRLRTEIEQAIATFEPRLAGVVVTPEGRAESDRRLRFRIDALLHVDPVREPVTFDTEIAPSGEAQVKAA